MADLNLGKQIGPLPLGAWVVVVGVGLGVAYYTTRNKASTVVEDGSGTPGVGVGGSGQYTELTPVVSPTTNAQPTTNEEWGVKAINWLIAMGYPSNKADSAVRKYLAGVTLDPQEYTMIGLALVSQGSPPQVLPPGEEQPPPVDTTPPPVDTTPPPTETTLGKPTITSWIAIWTFAIELHWSSVSGATGYNVYMDGTKVSDNWKAGTGKMIMGVQPGQTYSFTVSARKGSDEGPKSNAVSIRVPTIGEGGHTS